MEASQEEAVLLPAHSWSEELVAEEMSRLEEEEEEALLKEEALQRV